MSYQIQKFIKSFECFAIWENGFSEDELEKILFLEEDFDCQRFRSTHQLLEHALQSIELLVNQNQLYKSN